MSTIAIFDMDLRVIKDLSNGFFWPHTKTVQSSVTAMKPRWQPFVSVDTNRESTSQNKLMMTQKKVTRSKTRSEPNTDRGWKTLSSTTKAFRLRFAATPFGRMSSGHGST